MIGRHRFALTLGILILLGLIASSTPLLALTRDIWPTYLHDGRHSGRSPYVGPNGPFFRWTYPGSDASSVTIATDGTLRFCSENSNAYALNPDGTFRWSYGSSSQIWSTPAIATDGSILFECDGGKFYRVDSGGSLIWSWDGGDGNMAMSPVIADDLNMVFFLYSVSSLGNGVLRSLYMSGPNQGTVAWTQSFGGNMEFDKTSPAFDGDTVYVTGTEAVDGLSGVLVALEASTGTVKWTYPPSGTIDGVTYSSPSVSDDREFIYFGDDGDDHNEAVLYCVASDGTLAWAWDSPEAGAGILNAPVIGTDGTLYVVDTEANLFAIASDGTLKWSVELAAGTHLEYANAIIDAAGTIYVTANGGLFFGVSPFGQRCWAYDLGYGATTWLSPGSIGTAGTLYFSSRTRDTVYAVHTGSYLTNPAYTPDC
nr:hypothetical protein [Bacillota bacterium]